ncbi:MAG: hypothetical protein NTU80_02490 [Verrucomicrobia bacterium]|nr:hypothetical protein [Verrucomicrobiota bacterium]
MAQAYQFVIAEFTNPSGEIVFRVTGWLDDKRIGKFARAPCSCESNHPFLAAHCLTCCGL